MKQSQRIMQRLLVAFTALAIFTSLAGVTAQDADISVEAGLERSFLDATDEFIRRDERMIKRCRVVLQDEGADDVVIAESKLKKADSTKKVAASPAKKHKESKSNDKQQHHHHKSSHKSTHHKHHKSKHDDKKKSKSTTDKKDAGSSAVTDEKKDVASNNSTGRLASLATSGKVTSTKGSGSYKRVKQNRGSNFWAAGSWDFWTWDDPTHGQVTFQSEDAARKQNLIGMKDGAAFLRASNKDVWGNRPSIRFQSSKTYQSGLVIFDVKKMPVGAGTWPALWTTYGQNWPFGIEIDVMEGIGYTAGGQNANQMTVHTGQDSPLQNLNRRSIDKRGSGSYTGRLVDGASNCNQWGQTTGCAFFDSNKNGPSWGTDFNKAGGGIWAMQFGDGQGVKIWFWGRKSGKIPDELKDPSKSPENLDPSSWGTPVGNFQSWVINQKMMPQNIIVDLTIGGDWGSNVPLDGPVTGQSFWDAIKKGSNYNDAEFILNAIDIYQL